MKYIIYHARYGYIGMGTDPEYKDVDISEAALFTEESAKRLLVDMKDPNMVITPMTDDAISKLPFTLVDTQDMLDMEDNKKEATHDEYQQMTANAMSIMSDEIDNLNDEITLDLSELNHENALSHM